MKQQYSTFCLGRMTKEQRRFLARLSEREYIHNSWLTWIELCAKKPSPRGYLSRGVYYADTMLYFMLRYRKITHYFLAPGVASFCADSVRELTPEYCKRLPECDPVEPPQPPVPMVVVVDDDLKMPGCFAIHFPANERQRSILVWPDAEIPHTDRHSRYRFYFAASDGDDVVLAQKDSADLFLDGVDGGGERIARIVFGVSLYMDAFPDAVLPASSDDIKHDRNYVGPKHRVSANSIVSEEESRGVSPHWRRGHFRVLSSERFTRKKGQTVYVRGSFVMGTAFDVLDDAPGCDSNSRCEHVEA